ADQYGGSLANQFRLVGEVLDAVLQVWPANRVGIRLSPSGTFNAMSDSQPLKTFSHHVEQLNKYDLAYLHLVEVNEADLRHGGVEVPTQKLREIYNGTVMVCSDYNFERAKVALDEKLADFVVFGRLFIANPDLPERFELGAPLNEPDVQSFYGGTEKGYIDYPFLKERAA
ncbi:MAG: alkene reductase, partial [Limnobacter sp.]|nr:alkene reductase [Limnobacter sp.]